MSVKAIPQSEPFVIASQHRSGSHFLRTALRDRARLWCHGEIFNRYVAATDRWDGKMALDRWINIVYQEHPARTWGFVIHPTHWMAPYGRARGFVQRRAGKFIVISRRNTLRQACSWLIAKETDVWILTKKQRNPRLPVVNPSPKELLDIVCRLKEEHLDNVSLAKGKPILKVVYEDMIANPQQVFAGVQKFLGLKPRALRADTRQRETRPLKRVLGNYNQLQRHPALVFLFDQFS